MAIKQEVNELLLKKMDRKQFLRHLAIGMLAMTGVSAFLRAAIGSESHSAAQGYGGSAYGGHKPQ